MNLSIEDVKAAKERGAATAAAFKKNPPKFKSAKELEAEVEALLKDSDQHVSKRGYEVPKDIQEAIENGQEVEL